MTNDPTKWRGEHPSSIKPDDYVPWTIIDEPEHWPLHEGEGYPDLHTRITQLRHRLITLEELQRSAACQRAWLLAAIALVFVAVVVLMWVLS